MFEFVIAQEYIDKIIPLIDAAKFNIDIFMYHWGYYSYASKTNMQKINYALKSAITRGVKVRVLLHCGSPADHLKKVNSETYNHLISWGAQVKWHSRSGILHAKLVLIDKEIAILGSHNFSKRSMCSNTEISVILRGAGNIRRLQEFFDLTFTHN